MEKDFYFNYISFTLGFYLEEISKSLLCPLKGQVMAFISDSLLCRCIKTFEVEFSKEDQNEFSRINNRDTIFTSYVFSPGAIPFCFCFVLIPTGDVI